MTIKSESDAGSNIVPIDGGFRGPTVAPIPVAPEAAPATTCCTVVVPCYNEARRLRTDEFVRFLRDGQNSKIALLFVNDGSRDETLSLLEGLRSRFPARVFVLDQQPNRGKAEAVRNGMLHVIASGQAAVTGFWDADLATPLAQIRDMLGVMSANSQLNLIFGARVRLLGRAINRQPLRHYLGRCFATAVSLLLKVPIYDTQCGAKLFRVTDELQQVLSRPFLSRWIFDVEMLARFLAIHAGNARQLEKEACEFPLPEWTDVAGSKVSSMDFFKAVGELTTIYRRTLHDEAFSPLSTRQSLPGFKGALHPGPGPVYPSLAAPANEALEQPQKQSA
jgi:dolichyl-phosphate beta-glucosyltransferase